LIQMLKSIPEIFKMMINARKWCEKQESNDSIDIIVLWKKYEELRSPEQRAFRVLFWSLLFYAGGLLIIYQLGEVNVPYRGGLAIYIDKLVVIWFSLPLFVLLLFGVVDEIRLCVGWIYQLVDDKASWSKQCYDVLRKKHAQIDDNNLLRDWLVIDIIAKRTDTVGQRIYYPFVVLFILLLSQSRFFDNWDMSIGLLVMIFISSLYAIASAFILRRAAEDARETVISRMTGKFVTARNEQYVLPKGKKMSPAKQIKLLIEEVRNVHEGAFSSWHQQPVVKAFLWIFSGGGLILFQYLKLGY